MVEPIVWNQRTGNIVGGHQRLKVLRDKGVEETDVVVVDFDSNEEVALNVTLNNPAIQGEFDDQIGGLLAQLQGGLSDAFAELRMDDLRKALKLEDKKKPSDAEPQLDRTEELRKKWNVEFGQKWKLGEHLLVCGDCTNQAVVDSAMQGEKAQVLFTSPPYWVGFEYEKQDKWSEILAFIEKFCRLHVKTMSADGRIIINTGTVQAAKLTGQAAHTRLLMDLWVNALDRCGWLMRYVRFWIKDGGLMLTSPGVDCIDQHVEFIGYFYNPLSPFRGHERTSEPWALKGYWDDIHGAARGSGHIAAFPLELPLRNIQLFARSGEIVCDPFCGSGTTILACEHLGCRCRSIELSPAYVAVSLQRYSDATGKIPVRA
jgi:DNA modification methylase